MLLYSQRVSTKGTKSSLVISSILSCIIGMILVTSTSCSSEKSSQKVDSEITATLLIESTTSTQGCRV